MSQGVVASRVTGDTDPSTKELFDSEISYIPSGKQKLDLKACMSKRNDSNLSSEAPHLS